MDEPPLYHMIRLSVSSGNVAVYDLEDSAGTGANGTNANPWALIGKLPLGGSGNDPRNGNPWNGAFALGSLSGGTTTAGEDKWDWVGVSYGSLLVGHDPLYDQAAPEPTMLALLVLGSGPMVIRRRR